MIMKPLNGLSLFIGNWFEKYVVDGIVNGIGFITKQTSEGLKISQVGYIGIYVFAMVLSLVAILLISVI